MSKCYDITGSDLRKLVKAVYMLSNPQGLGYLHFKEGTLSETELDGILKTSLLPNGQLSLDYIHGRACKFHTDLRNGRTIIYESWFDHTRQQLEQLLSADGVVNNGLVEDET